MASVEESFAQNLRTYRKNAGMTQKMLGASIGYSEKAVSKWESGVLPPVAALVSKETSNQTTSLRPPRDEVTGAVQMQPIKVRGPAGLLL